MPAGIGTCHISPKYTLMASKVKEERDFSSMWDVRSVLHDSQASTTLHLSGALGTIARTHSMNHPVYPNVIQSPSN